MRSTLTRLATYTAAAALAISLVHADPQAPVDPKFTEAMQQGEDAIRTKRPKSALEAFGRANAIMDKKSAAALHGISRAHRLLGDLRSEANACKEALKHVGADDRLRAILHNARGAALASQATKNTDNVIREAEVEFRAALALPAPPPIAWYNLGVALLRQGRDEEGIAALNTYVASGARSAEVDIARRMIDNPRRAREEFAPEFSLTTTTGEKFSLKALEGKVVFIDFWGQWCGPCRAITPDLVALYQKFRTDSRFVMIGVSSDTRGDEQKWRDYIAQKKMEWPQMLDLRREVIPRFEIRAYPTGIVIGPDGVVLHREVGGGKAGVRDIDAAIRKALKAVSNQPVTSRSPSPLPAAAARGQRALPATAVPPPTRRTRAAR